MDRALVVGEGLLGCALVNALSEAGWTTIGSSRDAMSSKFFLNLTRPIPELPRVDVVYICAALANYKNCEGNSSAWVVNADAPVSIVRQCIERGMFPVFVSSDAIEFMSTAYTRMKSYAESCILPMGAAVVRPSKFTSENVDSLCRLMIRVGAERKPGVYRWS